MEWAEFQNQHTKLMSHHIRNAQDAIEYLAAAHANTDGKPPIYGEIAEVIGQMKDYIGAQRSKIDELEKIDETIADFVERVLGILREVGMPTDDCDGDEAPETILAGWIIANHMDAGHKIKELEQDKCGLAADALNARQVIHEFMAYVKCGQVPEDAHCVRRAKQLLASNLLDACAHEGGGGGGFSSAKPSSAEKQPNEKLCD